MNQENDRSPTNLSQKRYSLEDLSTCTGVNGTNPEMVAKRNIVSSVVDTAMGEKIESRMMTKSLNNDNSNNNNNKPYHTVHTLTTGDNISDHSNSNPSNHSTLAYSLRSTASGSSRKTQEGVEDQTSKDTASNGGSRITDDNTAADLLDSVESPRVANSNDNLHISSGRHSLHNKNNTNSNNRTHNNNGNTENPRSTGQGHYKATSHTHTPPPQRLQQEGVVVDPSSPSSSICGILPIEETVPRGRSDMVEALSDPHDDYDNTYPAEHRASTSRSVGSNKSSSTSQLFIVTATATHEQRSGNTGTLPSSTSCTLFAPPSPNALRRHQKSGSGSGSLGRVTRYSTPATTRGISRPSTSASCTPTPGGRFPPAAHHHTTSPSSSRLPCESALLPSPAPFSTPASPALVPAWSSTATPPPLSLGPPPPEPPGLPLVVAPGSSAALPSSSAVFPTDHKLLWTPSATPSAPTRTTTTTQQSNPYPSASSPVAPEAATPPIVAWVADGREGMRPTPPPPPQPPAPALTCGSTPSCCSSTGSLSERRQSTIGEWNRFQAYANASGVSEMSALPPPVIPFSTSGGQSTVPVGGMPVLGSCNSLSISSPTPNTLLCSTLSDEKERVRNSNGSEGDGGTMRGFGGMNTKKHYSSTSGNTNNNNMNTNSRSSSSGGGRLCRRPLLQEEKKNRRGLTQEVGEVGFPTAPQQMPRPSSPAMVSPTQTQPLRASGDYIPFRMPVGTPTWDSNSSYKLCSSPTWAGGGVGGCSSNNVNPVYSGTLSGRKPSAREAVGSGVAGAVIPHFSLSNDSVGGLPLPTLTRKSLGEKTETIASGGNGSIQPMKSLSSAAELISEGPKREEETSTPASPGDVLKSSDSSEVLHHFYSLRGSPSSSSSVVTAATTQRVNHNNNHHNHETKERSYKTQLQPKERRADRGEEGFNDGFSAQAVLKQLSSSSSAHPSRSWGNLGNHVVGVTSGGGPAPKPKNNGINEVYAIGSTNASNSAQHPRASSPGFRTTAITASVPVSTANSSSSLGCPSHALSTSSTPKATPLAMNGSSSSNPTTAVAAASAYHGGQQIHALHSIGSPTIMRERASVGPMSSLNALMKGEPQGSHPDHNHHHHHSSFPEEIPGAAPPPGLEINNSPPLAATKRLIHLSHPPSLSRSLFGGSGLSSSMNPFSAHNMPSNVSVVGSSTCSTPLHQPSPPPGVQHHVLGTHPPVCMLPAPPLPPPPPNQHARAQSPISSGNASSCSSAIVSSVPISQGGVPKDHIGGLVNALHIPAASHSRQERKIEVGDVVTSGGNPPITPSSPRQEVISATAAPLAASSPSTPCSHIVGHPEWQHSTIPHPQGQNNSTSTVSNGCPIRARKSPSAALTSTVNVDVTSSPPSTPLHQSLPQRTPPPASAMNSTTGSAAGTDAPTLSNFSCSMDESSTVLYTLPLPILSSTTSGEYHVRAGSANSSYRPPPQSVQNTVTSQREPQTTRAAKPRKEKKIKGPSTPPKLHSTDYRGIRKNIGMIDREQRGSDGGDTSSSVSPQPQRDDPTREAVRATEEEEDEYNYTDEDPRKTLDHSDTEELATAFITESSATNSSTGMLVISSLLNTTTLGPSAGSRRQSSTSSNSLFTGSPKNTSTPHYLSSVSNPSLGAPSTIPEAGGSRSDNHNNNNNNNADNRQEQLPLPFSPLSSQLNKARVEIEAAAANPEQNKKRRLCSVVKLISPVNPPESVDFDNLPKRNEQERKVVHLQDVLPVEPETSSGMVSHGMGGSSALNTFRTRNHAVLLSSSSTTPGSWKAGVPLPDGAEWIDPTAPRSFHDKQEEEDDEIRRLGGTDPSPKRDLQQVEESDTRPQEILAANNMNVSQSQGVPEKEEAQDTENLSKTSTKNGGETRDSSENAVAVGRACVLLNRYLSSRGARSYSSGCLRTPSMQPSSSNTNSSRSSMVTVVQPREEGGENDSRTSMRREVERSGSKRAADVMQVSTNSEELQKSPCTPMPSSLGFFHRRVPNGTGGSFSLSPPSPSASTTQRDGHLCNSPDLSETSRLPPYVQNSSPTNTEKNHSNHQNEDKPLDDSVAVDSTLKRREDETLIGWTASITTVSTPSQLKRDNLFLVNSPNSPFIGGLTMTGMTTIVTESDSGLVETSENASWFAANGSGRAMSPLHQTLPSSIQGIPGHYYTEGSPLMRDKNAEGFSKGIKVVKESVVSSVCSSEATTTGSSSGSCTMHDAEHHHKRPPGTTGTSTRAPSPSVKQSLGGSPTGFSNVEEMDAVLQNNYNAGRREKEEKRQEGVKKKDTTLTSQQGIFESDSMPLDVTFPTVNLHGSFPSTSSAEAPSVSDSAVRRVTTPPLHAEYNETVNHPMVPDVSLLTPGGAPSVEVSPVCDSLGGEFEAAASGEAEGVKEEEEEKEKCSDQNQENEVEEMAPHAIPSSESTMVIESICFSQLSGAMYSENGTPLNTTAAVTGAGFISRQNSSPTLSPTTVPRMSALSPFVTSSSSSSFFSAFTTTTAPSSHIQLSFQPSSPAPQLSDGTTSTAGKESGGLFTPPRPPVSSSSFSRERRGSSVDIWNSACSSGSAFSRNRPGARPPPPPPPHSPLPMPPWSPGIGGAVPEGRSPPRENIHTVPGAVIVSTTAAELTPAAGSACSGRIHSSGSMHSTREEDGHGNNFHDSHNTTTNNTNNTSSQSTSSVLPFLPFSGEDVAASGITHTTNNASDTSQPPSNHHPDGGAPLSFTPPDDIPLPVSASSVTMDPTYIKSNTGSITTSASPPSTSLTVALSPRDILELQSENLGQEPTSSAKNEKTMRKQTLGTNRNKGLKCDRSNSNNSTNRTKNESINHRPTKPQLTPSVTTTCSSMLSFSFKSSSSKDAPQGHPARAAPAAPPPPHERTETMAPTLESEAESTTTKAAAAAQDDDCGCVAAEVSPQEDATSCEHAVAAATQAFHVVPSNSPIASPLHSVSSASGTAPSLVHHTAGAGNNHLLAQPPQPPSSFHSASLSSSTVAMPVIVHPMLQPHAPFPPPPNSVLFTSEGIATMEMSDTGASLNGPGASGVGHSSSIATSPPNRFYQLWASSSLNVHSNNNSNASPVPYPSHHNNNNSIHSWCMLPGSGLVATTVTTTTTGSGSGTHHHRNSSSLFFSSMDSPTVPMTCVDGGGGSGQNSQKGACHSTGRFGSAGAASPISTATRRPQRNATARHTQSTISTNKNTADQSHNSSITSESGLLRYTEATAIPYCGFGSTAPPSPVVSTHGAGIEAASLDLFLVLQAAHTHNNSCNSSGLTSPCAAASTPASPPREPLHLNHTTIGADIQSTPPPTLNNNVHSSSATTMSSSDTGTTVNSGAAVRTVAREGFSVHSVPQGRHIAQKEEEENEVGSRRLGRVDDVETTGSSSRPSHQSPLFPSSSHNGPESLTSTVAAVEAEPQEGHASTPIESVEEKARNGRGFAEHDGSMPSPEQPDAIPYSLSIMTGVVASNDVTEMGAGSATDAPSFIPETSSPPSVTTTHLVSTPPPLPSEQQPGTTSADMPLEVICQCETDENLSPMSPYNQTLAFDAF